MVASISVTRQRDFLNDADGDTVADPGDTFIHTIIITNTGPDDATNVLLTESENGLTIDSGSFKIGPIANDDSLGSCVGNTPLSFTAGQLTGNDLDPDDGTPTLTITKINNIAIVEDVPIAVTGGTVTMTSPGNFVFDPTAGFEGAASFTYEVTDEQGVTSVAATPGSVSITVTDPIWYIDSLNGSDVTGDGTFDNPFATMAPISTGGTFDTGVMGDDAGDTIFLYDRGGTYTTSIVLEADQKLYGDNEALMANGMAIGASTNNTSIQYSGVGVTLATNNTIKGLNLTGTANGAIGIEDGGGSVTTGGGLLTIDNTSIMGSGKAVDIDQGGTLAVTLDTLSSQNSTTQGVQLAGTSSTLDAGLITGSFSATAGTIQTASDHNFQIGTGGGATNGGRIAVDYDGALNTSVSGSAVHISGRLGSAGDIRFDGNIFQDSGASTSSDGIAITTVASGNIFFTGTKTIDMVGSGDNAVSVIANSGAVVNFSSGAFNIDTDSGHGFAISQTSGQVNVSVAADVDTTSGRGISITGSTGGATNFTGGGLTITTATGDALHSNNAASGSSLTISGSGNTLATTTGGQLVDIANTGTSAITFDTMQTGSSVADDAISVNNLSGGTWTTNTITVTGTTGGLTSDGIVITGSSTTFNLGTVGVSNTTGDGIELNGANGVVTATSVSLQNNGEQGLEINGATNAVNINGGAIGNTNDSVAEGVLVTGGTGNVNVAASVTKTTAGNVVEVENHDSGTVTFSGAISATGSFDNGILINNSGGGTVAFTNATKTLTTGASNAVTISNNGAAVDFTGGGLVINTTGGTGISAGTTSTSTGGDLTVSGSGNTITSTTGSAFVLHGTDSDGITFQSISKNGGTATAIFIKDAGSDGFTITGTGSTANSGGTLQSIGDGGNNASNAVGHGVYVENTSNITLNNMLIGNGTTIENFGIRGLNVTNFTLRDSVINGLSGDTAGGLLESSVFFNNLHGVGLFEGNNISGGYIDNMRIHNNVVGANTLNLFVRDSANDAAIFGSNGTTNDASDALNVQVSSDNTVLMLVDGVQFTAWRGDGVQATATDTANLEVTIQNNTFFNAHSNIAAAGGIGVVITGTAGGGSWGVDYTVQDNQFTGSKGVALAAKFFSTGGGTARGFIDDNIIGTDDGVGGLGGSSEATGIFVDTELVGGGTGIITHYATISNNEIRDTKQSGINVGARAGSSLANNAVTEVYITNNIVEEMGGASSFAALHMTAGGNVVDFGIVRADISNNLFDINGTTNAYAPVFLDQIPGTSAKYEFPGHPGTNGDSAATDNYFDNTKANNAVLDPGQLDPGSFVFSPDAVIDNGVLQPAQTGSNTQLPTGAMQAADPPADEPAVEEPAPSDPTPPTDDAGDPGDGGDGDGGETGGGDSDGGDTGGGDPAPDPEPEPGHPVIVNDNVLTQAELDWLVEAAIQRWADVGASDAQLAAMRATTFSVAEMSGLYLGSSSAGNVYVDSDGAGHGWFLDTTPGDDGEYHGSGTRLAADAGGGAAGRMDLLTVLMHELGHQVGLDDDYNVNQADELMYGYANLGERRLPAADDLIGADMEHAGHESFVESPMVIPLLPDGKAVKVTYTSTVDTFLNQVINNPFSNTSTVSGDNFVTAVSTPEALTVDSLTLGNLVYIDANSSGSFDGGDTTVNGVDLTLFVDNGTTAGVLDAGDTQIDTAETSGGGLYSFDNLAPGDYIVRIDASNFASGGALENRITANGTADPDADATDGDDNGIVALGGSVASKTITLAYNTEPTAGTGNDTNNTLDFGFFLPNQAPVITSPATASGNEDTSIAITGLSVADVDAGTGDLLVTLSIANGTLDLGTTTGLTVVGENTGLVTLEGTLTNLNNALATLTFNPTADFNGSPVNLSITANDQGNTGPDPGLTGDANSEEDTATVAITVNAVVDIANDTVNLAEDAGPTDLTGANDPLANDTFENSGRAITAVSDPTNGTAVIDDNGTTLDLTDDFIVYTPDANYEGADSFTYTVTSGGVTEQATINVNLSAVNDAPTGADDTITAIEDTFRILNAIDFGFDDVDTGDVLSEVIINGVTGGTLYIDAGADGFDDPGDAVSTFPATVTAAQLASNLVAFKAAPNANGAGLGEITFNVVDDSGALNDTSVAENTLIVDVTAVNDAPTLDITATLAYDEGDLPAAIAPAADLGDIDSLNFGGGSLTVSFSANGTSADQLDVLTAGSISRSGNDILFGATDIGDVSGGTNGSDLVITFDSDATVARVEALIQAIGYSNSSDDPSEMPRTVNFLVDDGDGGTSTANDTATVTVNAINDGPVNTPGGVVNIAEDSGATTLSGMSIADPDSAGDDIIVGFSVEHGTLGINTGVVGGITAGDIQFQDATTIVVVATRAEINATLADAAGLTYTPDAHYHGNDTLEIATNDNGQNGDDPGLTGDPNNEQDLDTRQISISAANDPVSSTVTTPINVNEDTAGALTLSISDVDAALNPSGVYQVTLTSTNGTTTLTTLTGLTFSAGDGTDDALMTFRGTLADINTALGTASFKGLSNFNGAASVQIDVTDDVLGTVATGSGAGTSDSDTINITVDPVDDGATATNDAYTTDEDVDISGQNLLNNEADPDGGAAPTISQVNGMNVVGSEITLASGAKLTVNSDGTFTYKPNDAFDELAEFGSGASNTLDSDSFTYTLTTGGTATVNLTIQGAWSDPHLMLGTAGADTITGTALEDIFSPGTGADMMTGLGGDDVYEVDQGGDKTIEAFGEGNDEVRSTINWKLHKHLEDLTLLGAATNGTGNELANTIVGNAGNNVLDGLGGADEMRGGAGDDVYYVQNPFDQAIETSLANGTDTVVSDANEFTLGAFVENLFLVGNAVKGEGNSLANLILGNSRGNTLNGMGGADEMHGAGGDDLYHVDNAGDVIVELGGGGADTARASVSYTLSHAVNHLVLVGTAVEGTGNEEGNHITGNGLGNLLKGVDGNDRLTGGGGNDTLGGGKGNDRMQGDAGADRFVFSTALNPSTNVDDILDFSVADDSIWLKVSIFDQIGLGTLSAAAFRTGATPTTAAHRIIYDSATGNLYYDEDGSGSAHDQILFATLDPGLALTNADFVGF